MTRSPLSSAIDLRRLHTAQTRMRGSEAVSRLQQLTELEKRFETELIYQQII
jgi:hypothetical protein